jgi:hypothetical protein
LKVDPIRSKGPAGEELNILSRTSYGPGAFTWDPAALTAGPVVIEK